MKHFSVLAITAVSFFATTSADAQVCRSGSRYPISIPRRSVSVVVQRPVSYTFGACDHLTELSARMHEQANAICWEMHRQYRHNATFETTYAEMFMILQDVKHIRKLVALNRARPVAGDEDQIATDLHHVDQLYHHIENDIAHWRPRYVYGGRRLQVAMADFSNTLHNLMTNYGVRSRIGLEAPAPVGGGLAPPPAPVVPAPNVPFTPSQGTVNPGVPLNPTYNAPLPVPPSYNSPQQPVLPTRSGSTNVSLRIGNTKLHRTLFVRGR